MKRKILALITAISMTVLLAGCGGTGSNTGGGQQSNQPAGNEQQSAGGKETIKIICPYGVGGTSDAIMRKYALVANKHSNYNFIVENMTGGDGFQAANWYTDQDASTKDLIKYDYGVAYRHDLGKKYNTEIVDFDRTDIYPIADLDDRTWILYAKTGTTLADVLEKAKNGGIKMSGGNPLSDPHLALGSLLVHEGGKVMTVPYDGGAAQKKGLTDGEVDVFVGTTQAGLEDVEAGTIMPILAFGEGTVEGFKNKDGAITVPGIAGEGKAPELDAATDYTGSILPAGGFLAVRAGADQAWIDEMVQISKDVWADPEYSDWIAEIMLNRNELYDKDANAFLEEGCKKAVAAFELLSGQQ